MTATTATAPTQIPDPVDWATARSIARFVAGRDPLNDSYLATSLQQDFDALTVQAEELVAGYTGLRAPAGVRARVLDPECTQFDGMEIVIRDDGGNGDLGYPWATMISKNRALVVYYFNRDDKTRHISGTFLEIE